MPTLQDIYADDIVVRRDGKHVEVTVNDRGRSAQALVDDDGAEAFANALLETAGRTRPTNGLVHAGDVSLNEALLRLAAIHEVEVAFRYAKGDGSVIETRRFVPSEVQTVGDHLTFVGYDPDRDEPRAFRVDRIKGQVSV